MRARVQSFSSLPAFARSLVPPHPTHILDIRGRAVAEWAPLGAERFVSLAAAGFFDQCRFFRVLQGFVAQFGINGDPAVQARYRSSALVDDPVTQSNIRGSVVFATSGKDSRTTQVCVYSWGGGGGGGGLEEWLF